MKIINILFCLFLIMLSGCNSNDNDTFKKNNINNTQEVKSRGKRDLDTKESQQEKITLTDEESKLFNSLVTAFKYTIEKVTNGIQGCPKDNKSKCTNFFDWLLIDIQKQKELAGAFKKVYEFLEGKRQSKEKDRDFDTYIKDGINCKVTKDNAQNQNGNQNQNDCDKDNKYGNGTNEIEQYFRGVANDMSNKNDNDEIYQYLKEELEKTDNHYAGLTSDWNN
uniref:Surface-exposed lipoprotein n=1 Tax=Borreliella afzelii TaxID=29518 RepID=P70813_BORAF|nr:surface-exposed lipoprotein [Borreliella afzelii]